MSSPAEALKNEGNARKAGGDLAGAAACYRRALEAQPDYVAALYNLGLVMRELQELAEAEACFRRVLELEPRDVEALFNLAALLRRRLSLDEAAAFYRRAIELAPDNASLWLMLGEVGLARYSDESLKEATDCFTRASELRPDLADAHYGLGQACEYEGRHAEALAAYQHALRLDPGNTGIRTALLTEKQRVCDWPGLEALCDEVRRDVVEQPAQPVHPFSLLAIPSTPAEQRLCAGNYAQAIMRAVAGQREAMNLRFERAGRQKCRIGYLSADFGEHATAYLAAELFELHDRARFEVFAFSYGLEEGSATRERLRRAFDRFVDIRPASDADAARAIHAEGIDILVDLKGYTFHARPEILALRPAPVQVSYLGYPGTMGAPFIDYLVSDRFVTPHAHAAYYSERLVLMPHSYQVNDRHRPAGAVLSRAALGLAESACVLCCFNQSYKILPQVFAAWMRIMKDVPGSILWLLEWNASAPHNLRREAGRQGVDPARLVFSPLAPLATHLGRMRLADLFLDTTPVNAHTTASEALWAGLPVLTCRGETFASRVAGSLLHAARLPELVTDSLAEYEALAVRLAATPGALAKLRAALQEGRDSADLFDTPRFVRDLESAYDRMWRIHVSGQPPAPMDVQSSGAVGFWQPS